MMTRQMTSRFTSFLIFGIGVCLVYLNGCSNVKDEPIVKSDLPDSIVTVFKDAFPAATDAVFKKFEFEKEKFYEVNYNIGAEKFYSVLNTRNILKSFRLLDDVPDSLRKKVAELPPPGGVMSDFRVPLNGTQDTVMISRYKLDGKDYTASWRGDPGLKLRLDMAFHFKLHYQLNAADVNKMPDKILTFLQQNKLTFSQAWVYVKDDNTARYDFHASDGVSLYFFSFDTDGTLEYSDYTNRTRYMSLAELPVGIQNFLNDSPIFLKRAFFQAAAKYELDGKVAYSVDVSVMSDDPARFSTFYRVIFDKDGGFKWLFCLAYD
jgi:hypothetical protein